MAIINSYLLFKAAHQKAKHKKFQIKVAEEMIGGYTDRKRVQRQTDDTSLMLETSCNYKSVRMPGRPRACRYCLRMKSKTKGGRAKEASYGCAQCNVNLHRDCFVAYHSDMQRKATKLDKFTQTGEILLTPTKERRIKKRTPDSDITKLTSQRSRRGRHTQPPSEARKAPLRVSPRKKKPAVERKIEQEHKRSHNI